MHVQIALHAPLIHVQPFGARGEEAGGEQEPQDDEAPAVRVRGGGCQCADRGRRQHPEPRQHGDSVAVRDEEERDRDGVGERAEGDERQDARALRVAPCGSGSGGRTRLGKRPCGAGVPAPRCERRPERQRRAQEAQRKDLEPAPEGERAQPAAARRRFEPLHLRDRQPVPEEQHLPAEEAQRAARVRAHPLAGALHPVARRLARGDRAVQLALHVAQGEGILRQVEPREAHEDAVGVGPVADVQVEAGVGGEEKWLTRAHGVAHEEGREHRDTAAGEGAGPPEGRATRAGDARRSGPTVGCAAREEPQEERQGEHQVAAASQGRDPQAGAREGRGAHARRGTHREQEGRGERQEHEPLDEEERLEEDEGREARDARGRAQGERRAQRASCQRERHGSAERAQGELHRVRTDGPVSHGAEHEAQEPRVERCHEGRVRSGRHAACEVPRFGAVEGLVHERHAREERVPEVEEIEETQAERGQVERRARASRVRVEPCFEEQQVLSPVDVRAVQMFVAVRGAADQFVEVG